MTTMQKTISRTDKGEPITDSSWPKNTTATIETRKRDLVIRIADWTRQSVVSGEPAYDVEVYYKGVYDWNESKGFCLRDMTKAQARAAAVAFAQAQIAKFMA